MCDKVIIADNEVDSMGVAAHSAPNYQAALASYSIPEGPVITNAGTPPVQPSSPLSMV